MGGQVQLLRPPGAKIWCSRCTPHRGAIGSEGSVRQEVPLARKPRQKLGEILVGLGVVTLAQVDEAFAAARARGMRLGEILVAYLATIAPKGVAPTSSTVCAVPEHTQPCVLLFVR